ncbi:hypothetical protein [Castellaniella sp.]|uniref:hypothetical protein n=1 Tax=Castellaniella sp. TaxID=1955812 RepID=UPI002AFFDE0D|nr:hypothetical protein [Castellaniella sp.]
MTQDIDAELAAFLDGIDKEIKGQETVATAKPETAKPETAKPENPVTEPDKGEPRVGIEASPAIDTQTKAAPDAPPTPPVPANVGDADPGVVKQADGSALKAYVDADALKKDVQVSITDLDNVMIQHAALYVHYATQTVNARRQYDRVKSAVEILEAQLDSYYRNRAADEGKKTTETQLKGQVTGDPRYADAQKKLIDAHSIWKLADIAERAMEQRKDMILEVARDRRKEREGQLRVLELRSMKEEFLKNAGEKAA